jgi:hypothetical protein
MYISLHRYDFTRSSNAAVIVVYCSLGGLLIILEAVNFIACRVYLFTACCITSSPCLVLVQKMSICTSGISM